MVRFMAMKSSKNIARVRFYYYFFYILFFALTIATALIARLVFTDNSDFDTELALPMMAQKIFTRIFNWASISWLIFCNNFNCRFTDFKLFSGA